MGLIFNEESMLSGNVFKFEQRLQSQVNKYLDDGNGPILTTYYNLRENATTVDRGLQDIEKLFGNKSPLRFNRIENFPIFGFNQAAPINNDEQQVEDITVEGDAIIQPSTIVPHPNDFFTVNHLRMRAVFQVVEVTYDAMRINGYYRIRYRLQSTSQETVENLEKQTVARYHCKLDAVGTDLNPIISEDDYAYRSKIEKVLNGMIDDYRAMFYNKRHNCFLCSSGEGRLFDLCGNEFIAKHSLMNKPNSTDIIMLHHKLDDSMLSVRYRSSVYRWIEDGAPAAEVRYFSMDSLPSSNYLDSTFYRWSEFDIGVLVPAPVEFDGHDQFTPVFNIDQVEFFSGNPTEYGANDYDNLIKMYVTAQLTSVSQIPLSIGNTMRNQISDLTSFIQTPIVIYIIRSVLGFN